MLTKKQTNIMFVSMIATSAIAGGHGVMVGGAEMVKDKNITVEIADVAQLNGVIHVIDAVLLPKQ